MTKQVSSAESAIFVLTLALFVLLAHPQATPAATVLTPGKSFASSSDANTYNYFASSFNITKKLLAVTVDPLPSANNTLFLSLKDPLRNLTFAELPNSQQFLQKCQQNGLNTCIIRLEDAAAVASGRPVTVYFSVFASESMSYSVLVELVDEVAMAVGQSQTLSFGKASAAVLKVTATNGLTAVFSYNKIGGSFLAAAAAGEIPHSSINPKAVINSTANGAYHQLMKLPAIGNASDYYILVQSQRGSTIEMKVYESDTADLVVNSSLVAFTNSPDAYFVVLNDNTSSVMTNGLRLKLSPYTGFGSFHVEYCDQFLMWQCGNTDGIICEVVITAADRTACASQYIQDNANATNSTNDTDFTESLVVIVENPWNFGYELSLFEEASAEAISINHRLLGLFVPQQAQQVFALDVPTAAYTYFLNYTQNTTLPSQSITFSLQECQAPKKNTNASCTAIASSTTASGQLSFTAKSGCLYSLLAHQPAQSTITYELTLAYNQVNVTELAAAKKYTQEIALREYKFYRINLTSLQLSNPALIEDIAQVNITLQTLNGKVDLLSSLAVPDPTLPLYSSNSSLIRFQLAQTVVYLVNRTTEVIYLSAYGEQASLFYLEFTIDGNVDLPIRYFLMKDGDNSTFTLNKAKPYQLLSYSPHIRPYSIAIAGNPKCIRYGYSLPLGQTCAKRLPTQLQQQTLYLNISNGNSPNNFSFGVTVSSGEYVLTYDNAIVIACNAACYSLLNATIEIPSRAIIRGKGEIHLADDSSQANLKDALQLACDAYPCMLQLNATLNFGGSLSVYLEESQITYLNDSAIPFPPSQLPKNFIFPIKSAEDINDLVVRADGATVAASYSIVTLDSELDNIRSINFTALSLGQNTYYYEDSLRNTFVLSIAGSELNRLGCSLGSTVCFAAVTLYLNIDVPSSTRFMNRGWATASSNRNPATQLQINSPLPFNDTLRVNHLQYALPASTVEALRLDVEAVSSCRPVVVDPSSTNQYVYGPIIYSKPTQAINVSVLSKGPCVYTVALTNSVHRAIYPNKYYTLDTNAGELIVTLLFSFDGTPGFTITAEPEPTYQISAILANAMQNSYDPIVVPTLQASAFSSSNSNTLTVSQQKYYHVYSIKVVTTSPTVKLIVENADTTTLAHDTTFTHSLQPGAKKSFLILSRRLINLQADSPFGKLELNVSESDGSLPFSTNTINSQTRILPISEHQVDNQVVSYGVTVRNIDKVPLEYSLLFSQSPQYIPEVYQRIVRYDSFSSPDMQNCYNYQAPVQFGRDKVVVDFVLDADKYQNCSCIDLDYRIRLKSTKQDKVDALLRPALTKLATSAHAYRLEMTFVAGETYTLCFSTPNRSAIHKEYYLLVNSPVMRHLVAGETAIKYLPMALDSFQIIEEGVGQNVMFELTLCDPQADNDKALTGTSYFSDYMFGTYSDLTGYHKNSESLFAMLTIGKGHFFLAVKNQQLLQGAYSLRLTSVGQDSRLLATAWDLRSKQIEDIAYDRSGKIVISLPKLVSLTDAGSQDNISLTYTLYVIDTTAASPNSSEPSPASVLARCPGYNFSRGAAPFLKQQAQPALSSRTASFAFSSLEELLSADHQVQLSFDPAELPPQFNLTGTATVRANAQTFSYYYSARPVELAKIENQPGSSHSSAIAIAVVLIVLIAGAAGFLWYRRSRKQEEVDFELANFSSSSPARDKNEGLILTPKAEEKGYREMNDEVK